MVDHRVDILGGPLKVRFMNTLDRAAGHLISYANVLQWSPVVT